MSATESAFAARLHAHHFPHGFLARAGHGVLRAWYDAARTSPAAVTLVAATAEGPVGYLFGTSDDAGHRAHVVRRCGPRLAAALVAGLAVRPALLATFLRTRLCRYAARAAHAARGARPATTGRGATATLHHIAVDPEVRSSGAGKSLVTAYEAELRRRGVSTARLVTLAGPAGAGPFYARLGWTRTGETTGRDERRFEVWCRDLSATAAPSATAATSGTATALGTADPGAPSQPGPSGAAEDHPKPV
ncbi:MAG: GNAT family N-acetyltransferase [Actinomycetota bacterium]|nr:GNAT family N-acetyltransferase [Actinomycetota bacterium]